jgi:hypothetical protein
MSKKHSKIDTQKFYKFRVEFYEKNCNDCIFKEKGWGYKSEIIICGKRDKPMYEFLKSLYIYRKLPFCHIAVRQTKEQKLQIAEPVEINHRNNSRPIIKVLGKCYKIEDWLKPKEEFFIYF